MSINKIYKFARKKKLVRKILTFLTISLIFISCKKEEGCTDPLALNYNSQAILEDGSCTYAPTPISNLDIHFSQTVNGEPLILDSMIYINQSNINYSIQTVRYLISNITLHTNDETNTLIDNVHFVDVSIDSTLKISIPQIANNDYTSISFTMGLPSEQNFTDLFLNENFFPSFAWPEFLGGGYHYMQLEGDFNTVFNGYTTHTGGTFGIDYSFNKNFPISLNPSNGLIGKDIYINMEITNWYQNPEIFNLTSAGIMGDTASQNILQANGIEDVFSVFMEEIID